MAGRTPDAFAYELAKALDEQQSMLKGGVVLSRMTPC
jgi:hypothetical protein